MPLLRQKWLFGVLNQTHWIHCVQWNISRETWQITECPPKQVLCCEKNIYTAFPKMITYKMQVRFCMKMSDTPFRLFPKSLLLVDIAFLWTFCAYMCIETLAMPYNWGSKYALHLHSFPFKHTDMVQWSKCKKNIIYAKQLIVFVPYLYALAGSLFVFLDSVFAFFFRSERSLSHMHVQTLQFLLYKQHCCRNSLVCKILVVWSAGFCTVCYLSLPCCLFGHCVAYM